MRGLTQGQWPERVLCTPGSDQEPQALVKKQSSHPSEMHVFETSVQLAGLGTSNHVPNVLLLHEFKAAQLYATGCVRFLVLGSRWSRTSTNCCAQSSRSCSQSFQRFRDSLSQLEIYPLDSKEGYEGGGYSVQAGHALPIMPHRPQDTSQRGGKTVRVHATHSPGRALHCESQLTR